jgi:diadenylate cyclase
MIFLQFFDVGFLDIRFADLLDILIVGFLIYQIYRLLRGTLAFNIFVGVLSLYLLWWLVRAAQMELLSLILGQFVSVGVIVVAIVFQPELRRFLLLLGNQTLRGRLRFLNKFSQNLPNSAEGATHLKEAILELSNQGTGALIVVANHLTLSNIAESGIQLDARITKQIILSIFNKESPLHDGALIISDNRLKAASCVMPLSENPDLPESTGLRHRAAVGISEVAPVAAFVVSEETGKISFAFNGAIKLDLDSTELEALLKEYL